MQNICMGVFPVKQTDKNQSNVALSYSVHTRNARPTAHPPCTCFKRRWCDMFKAKQLFE